MQRAIAALARREYSRADLERRLARYVDQERRQELVRVLDELQAKGLLSDNRFAAMFARSRSQRFGAARIRHELREHGLDDELVRAVIQPLAATEEQRARAVWRKRFGRAPANAAERARQLRFLSQRGFATDVILRVVGRGGSDGDD